MNKFKTPALEELADHNVRFVPAPRRMQHVSRAERLLTEIKDEKEYPYQYICYRITEYRSDAYPELVVSGQDLRQDLGALIARLAGSMPAVPIEAMGEQVLTLEEISKKLNVTTKTINRWRKRGLIGIPVVLNGRRHVGFLPSLVDPFLSANHERIEKSSQFSQLTREEKDDILRRAQRFSRFGVGTLTQISRRIARRVGRSPETVRYTIKNFDREHPELALFPSVTGSLDSGLKQTIFNSFRRGIPVETLAKRFARTRSSMYRVINEIRAQRLMDQPVDYIPSPAFDDPALEANILGAMPDGDKYEEARRGMRVPKDAPPELASLYETPLLTKEQEQHLFRKMNFLKFKAKKILDGMKLSSGKINAHKVRTQDLDEVDVLLDQANAVKDQLISANMRLVVSVAKRHSAQADNFFELLSDGNMSLIRAVEKFDYFRGNKFSTYASWAIIKNFARSIPEEKTRRERYVTGNEEVFDATQDRRSNEREILATAEQASCSVNRLLEHLDSRERAIIRMRAGLEVGSEGMTLEKIGEKLGITKERVRQLNVRAMKKLRGMVEGKHDELM